MANPTKCRSFSWAAHPNRTRPRVLVHGEAPTTNCLSAGKITILGRGESCTILHPYPSIPACPCGQEDPGPKSEERKRDFVCLFAYMRCEMMVYYYPSPQGKGCGWNCDAKAFFGCYTTIRCQPPPPRPIAKGLDESLIRVL